MDKACYKRIHPKHKYRLVEPYSYNTGFNDLEETVKIRHLSLEENGLLKFEKGFTWDGPSGPSVDTLNIMRGSLIHDGIYRLIRNEKIDYNPFKVRADKLLKKICRCDGTFCFRAWYIYIAVRLFGGRSARPEKIVCVPRNPN